jgi:hypothetical protein
MARRKTNASEAEQPGDAHEPESPSGPGDHSQTLQEALADQSSAADRAGSAQAEPVQGDPKKPRARHWADRCAQPVSYSMFTAKDQTRKEQIMFKFNLPAGQDKPDDAAIAVMRSFKKTDDGYETGLHFEQDRVYGPVWKLPNNPAGREVADSIIQALDELGASLEKKSPPR